MRRVQWAGLGAEGSGRHPARAASPFPPRFPAPFPRHSRMDTKPADSSSSPLVTHPTTTRARNRKSRLHLCCGESEVYKEVVFAEAGKGQSKVAAAILTEGIWLAFGRVQVIWAISSCCKCAWRVPRNWKTVSMKNVFKRT